MAQQGTIPATAGKPATWLTASAMLDLPQKCDYQGRHCESVITALSLAGMSTGSVPL
jgi:hypothetical protein